MMEPRAAASRANWRKSQNLPVSPIRQMPTGRRQGTHTLNEHRRYRRHRKEGALCGEFRDASRGRCSKRRFLPRSSPSGRPDTLRIREADLPDLTRDLPSSDP